VILDALDAERVDTFGRKHQYQDQSTVCVMPTRGVIPAKVYDSHMSLMRLPNQKWTMLTISGTEVSAAYEWAVSSILANPDMASWKWILTLEEDNVLPYDAFTRLVAAATEGGYDVLGGLYWIKGEEGCPQIWGDRNDDVENYRPQAPDPDGGIVDCWGTGMGCTLFRLDLFRNMPQPWFHVPPEDGMWTQDLRFFNRLYASGATPKVGVHCGVKVGHFDVNTGVTW
jgi:hypothetical protein